MRKIYKWDKYKKLWYLFGNGVPMITGYDKLGQITIQDTPCDLYFTPEQTFVAWEQDKQRSG